MSTVSVPQQETTVATPGQQSPQRGLTLRSFIICIFSLLLMGMWIEYEELYNYYGGPLAENAPPNSAIGVIIILLVISAILYRFRRSFRLTTAELVVILSALLVAAPLMTQGMWHRFFGLVAAIPHNQDFKSYQSLSENLWPHGDNLVPNHRFADKDAFAQSFRHTGGGKLAWEEVDIDGRGKTWHCPVLDNGGNAAGHAALEFSIPRKDAQGKDTLIPGEYFFFAFLARAKEFAGGSYYSVDMRADSGKSINILRNTGMTSKSFALPSEFERVGISPLIIPLQLKEKLTFTIALTGPGTLSVQDIQFFNSQAVEGLYTGVRVVRESQYGQLGDHERNFTVVKPDNMFSLAGARYLLTGFIPLEQWARPMLAWSLLIGLLFMGFFAMNVLMRKQWLEFERFSFPMNFLPRELFAEETDAAGRKFLSIFRNRMMWLGFGIAFFVAVLKGLHYYNPAIPAPSFGTNSWDTLALTNYVTHPLLKVYLQNVSLSLIFTLLAIALLVETNILFSIWACFLLFQLVHVFGKAFNFTASPGYPWEWQQSIGSFIGYALLAAYIGRQHLWKIVKHLVGRQRLDDTGEIVTYRTAVLMIALTLVGLVCWGLWTRMGAVASLLFFGWMLVCGFAASKIRAEAGMPFGYWMPYYGMLFVSAVGGFAVFGTVGMLVSTIASGFMCVACFLFIAPVQVEMMELGRRFHVRLRDIGHGLLLGLLGGLLFGGFVLLCWGYGFGADSLQTSWPYEQDWYFNSDYRGGESAADRAFLSGKLYDAPESQWFNISKNINAKGISIGIVVTWVLAFLRATIVGFPLHPLGYVLACTYFPRMTWFTLFIAWAVRALVFRLGGAHTIRKVLVPFCVGMFLACVVSVIMFDLIGMILRANGMTSVYCQIP
ncbi:MAG: DUF6785 family protein [Armatimonadota bacterium]